MKYFDNVGSVPDRKAAALYFTAAVFLPLNVGNESYIPLADIKADGSRQNVKAASKYLPGSTCLH